MLPASPRGTKLGPFQVPIRLGKHKIEDCSQLAPLEAWLLPCSHPTTRAAPTTPSSLSAKISASKRADFHSKRLQPAKILRMVLAYADASALGEVSRATAALLFFFYVVLFAQSYVKLALVKRARKAEFGALSHLDVRYTDPEVSRIKYAICHHSPISLVADRTVGNLMEQLLPLLCATWLRAVLVPGAAESAGRLAWAYLVSRIAYPLAFYAGHPLLQLSTQPGYLIVWGQLVDLVVSAGDSPEWWSSERCEKAIFVLIGACELVILAQWALVNRCQAQTPVRSVANSDRGRETREQARSSSSSARLISPSGRQ